jgi:outer membrane protein assembly factor BamB
MLSKRGGSMALIRTVAILVVSVVTVACAQHEQAPQQWTGQDWPTYQATADHNAVVADASAPAGVRWTTDLKAKINGGLAYSGGLVFVATFDYRLVALDARTGAVRWQTKFDNVLMSSPVIRAGRVIVGSGDNGMSAREGSTFAYSSLLEDTSPFWGREAGDHIFALDPGTGAQQWSFRTAGEDMPSPVLFGEHVVFANGDGHAYSLELKSGAAQWQTALPGISTMASATASASGMVFVSVCGTGLRGSTEALDAKSGKIRWQVPYGDCDSSPTLGDGKVFLAGVSGNEQANGYGGAGVIAALDPFVGKVAWVYRTPRSGLFSRISSSERAIAGAYVGGMFFDAVPTTDQLLALDARTGALRWSVQSVGPIKMSPVVRGGKLYVGDTAGILYAIDAKTGRVIDTQMFAAPFTTSPPIIVGSELFVVNGTSIFAEPVAAIRHKASKLVPL